MLFAGCGSRRPSAQRQRAAVDGAAPGIAVVEPSYQSNWGLCRRAGGTFHESAVLAAAEGRLSLNARSSSALTVFPAGWSSALAAFPVRLLLSLRPEWPLHHFCAI